MKRLDAFDGARESWTLASSSPLETMELGRRIGSILPAGTVISLEGGLGVGKTLLTKGICAGLGVEDEVVSPSFILVEEYEGELPVMHFDLYRLELVQEALDIGILDAMDGGNVVIVEWGDKLPDGMLRADIHIRLKITGGEERDVSIEAMASFLEALREVTDGS